MLTNEKYKGDTLLQKTFTEDFMTGKKSKNIGQRNRYYVRDSHAAIVFAEIFDRVQEEMAKRSRLVSNARMVPWKSAAENITANTFLGICLYVAIAEHLTGEGLRGARLSGAVRPG